MEGKKNKNTLPEIKKKISSYLTSEDGKITKEAIIAVGTFVTSAAASAALLSKTVAAGHENHPTHKNDIDINYNTDAETAIGRHSHTAGHNNVHSSY